MNCACTLHTAQSKHMSSPVALFEHAGQDAPFDIADIVYLGSKTVADKF